MFDPKKLLDQLMGAQMPGGSGGTVGDKAGQVGQMARNNPLATGAIAAVLLGTKPGRKLAGSAVKFGGMAAIAALGYQAYRNYQSGKQPGAVTPPEAPQQLPSPEESGFDTDPDRAEPDFALALVRAMIAAARADGHIDAEERRHIHEKLKVSGMGPEAQQFLEDELDRPTDLDAIIAAARSEEQRVEIYTASRLTIDPDTRAERGYLDLLAGRLGLADPLVDHIEATVSQAKV